MPNSRYGKNQRPSVEPPRVGLADLRKSHKLTQANVADQVASIIDADFYSGSLSLIEKGHRGASPEVLAALEQVFGLGPGALVVDYTPKAPRRKLAEPA